MAFDTPDGFEATNPTINKAKGLLDRYLKMLEPADKAKQKGLELTAALYKRAGMDDETALKTAQRDQELSEGAATMIGSVGEKPISFLGFKKTKGIPSKSAEEIEQIAAKSGGEAGENVIKFQDPKIEKAKGLFAAASESGVGDDWQKAIDFYRESNLRQSEIGDFPTWGQFQELPNFKSPKVEVQIPEPAPKMADVVPFPAERATKSAPAVLDEGFAEPIGMQKFQQDKVQTQRDARASEWANKNKQGLLKNLEMKEPSPKASGLLQFPTDRVSPAKRMRKNAEVIEMPDLDARRAAVEETALRQREQSDLIPGSENSAAEKIAARMGENFKIEDAFAEPIGISHASSPYAVRGTKNNDISNVVWGDASRGYKSKGPAFTIVKDFEKNVPTSENGAKILGANVPQGGQDPFGWVDRKYGLTKDFLQNNQNKPLEINTRSDLIAMDEYMEALNPDLHEINIHVGGYDDQTLRVLEPGNPSNLRRIQAVEKLVSNGIPVTVKIDEFEYLPKGKGMPNQDDMLTIMSVNEKSQEQMQALLELEQRSNGRLKLEPNVIPLTKEQVKMIQRELRGESTWFKRSSR